MRTAPDPYFPGHGDQRYTVEHYDLTLRYKVSTNRLDGRAVLRVRALTDLNDLRLDLFGLQVHGVTVDGRRPRRHEHRGGALTVRLATPLPAGASAVVSVPYSGKPRPVPGPFGPAGWEELDDGVIVASQPYGAPSWYPCNDHAGDKATYRFDVTTEAAYVVVANGVLAERRPNGGSVRWVYVEERPMAPYLAALHIGRYVVSPLDTGRPPVDLVAPPALDAAGTPFDRVPAMIRQLVGWFGPYPFAEYRCVVTPDVLEIPLEAQGLASFGRNHRADTWDNERLVVHELSHQWFGNSVTAPLGRDIWLHEGFACYTEWLWSEARGLDSADAWARRHHARLAEAPVGWPLADPGVANMFDDEVYKRGALTLHALGGVLGREGLLALLRDWCAEHRDGLVATADFERFAQGRAPVDLVPFFRAWLHSPALPALPS